MIHVVHHGLEHLQHASLHHLQCVQPGSSLSSYCVMAEYKHSSPIGPTGSLMGEMSKKHNL